MLRLARQSRYLRVSFPFRVFARPADSLQARTVKHQLHSTSTKSPLITPKLPLQKAVAPILAKAFSSANVIPFLLADIGEGIHEVEVLQWFVKEGEPIAQFDRVCEVQSDKATVEITSRFDGTVSKLHYNVGDMAKVGSPLIDITTSEGTGEAESVQQDTPPSSSVAKPESGENVTDYQNIQTSRGVHKTLATPAVRRIAREHAIDLSAVPATGKNGRVLKEDILAFIDSSKRPPAETTAPGAPPPPSPIPVTIAAEDRVEPITGIRKAMVKSMTAASYIPHFGYCDEVEMDALVQLRTALKPTAEAQGIRLSYMPFFLKAISLALKEYPILNASVNSDCTELVYHACHNLGVAMDTPQGLIVPVIKDVQTKSLLEIAHDLNRLHEDGLAGKLSPSDLTGGTFSLSNIGTIGGTYLKPVIAPPNVAIGAIGKIQKLPRFAPDGSVKPVSIMQVSWSADHRVIDGATMARFSNKWKNFVEVPTAMIMEMR